MNRSFLLFLTCFLILTKAQAQTTLYADDFETAQTWTIFEEIVSGNTCYGDNIGEVARSIDFAHAGTNGLRVWANKNAAMKSNHVIAAHPISNTEGVTGLLKFSTWVYCNTNLGLTQSGPEFSLQSTRTVGGQNLTYIAGVQYLGNQWLTDKWQIWHNGTWKTILLSEFNVTLTANTWYYMELSFNLTSNKYHSLKIKGGSVDATLGLTGSFSNAATGFEIGGEARGWTPSYFVTLESENLWSNCTQVHDNKVYYDNLKLEKNTATPSVKGLYVDDFHNILGNTAKENALLNYAQSKGFNYLALYELHYFDYNNANDRNKLANFIRKAKTTYSIAQVGATGEIASFFRDRILAQYQASRTDPLEKFDVLDLEFEFWSPVFTNSGGYYCTTYLQPNGLTCDRAGAFTFYMQQLTELKQLCTANNLICETEFGWFTQAEANQFVPLSDRILVHSYVQTAWVNGDAATFYNYTKDRLQYIANATTTPKEVMVIFSSENAFSGPWLTATTPLRAPSAGFDLYKTYYDAETAAWKNNLAQVGSIWFAYTFMPENGVVLPIEIIDFKGQSREGGNFLSFQLGDKQNLQNIELLKSQNGRDFTPLSILDKNANDFLDKNPFQNTFYRLKIKDLEGKTSLSKIILIERKSKTIVKVFPSLTSGILTIENVKSFEIVNAVGQVVLKEGVGYLQGIRHLTLEHLPNGIYFIKGVDTEGGIFSEKIIKQ